MWTSSQNDAWFLEQVKIGRISVSRYGKVVNLKTKRKIGALSSNRYLKISLFYKRDGGNVIVRNIQLHRLVWVVYRGPIPDGMILNHKDCNKLNPRISNLELSTPKENARHAIANGKYKNLFKTGNKIHLKRKSFGRKKAMKSISDSDSPCYP